MFPTMTWDSHHFPGLYIFSLLENISLRPSGWLSAPGGEHCTESGKHLQSGGLVPCNQQLPSGFAKHAHCTDILCPAASATPVPIALGQEETNIWWQTVVYRGLLWKPDCKGDWEPFYRICSLLSHLQQQYVCVYIYNSSPAPANALLLEHWGH